MWIADKDFQNQDLSPSAKEVHLNPYSETLTTSSQTQLHRNEASPDLLPVQKDPLTSVPQVTLTSQQTR